MRTLRVVGITGDVGGGGPVTVVLEDPERRERFTVPADETLRAAARGDLTRLGQISIEVGSELRPREIQTRIRAGASVAELASAAGVPEQKIERFAYPVLLERSRTAELASAAHPVRADGPDSRTLAEVVADTFGMRGQDYEDASWDSWKGEDGRWVVALSWTAGRSDNRAHWTFQPGASGGTVTAVDDHAGDLVEGLPARPLRTIGPVIDLARVDEPDADAVAEPVRRVEPRAEAATAARRIEHRRTEPIDESRPAVSEPIPARPDDAPVAEPTPPVEPELPAAPAPAAPARRTKKGKPVMPSWDEVLLGVKGQR